MITASLFSPRPLGRHARAHRAVTAPPTRMRAVRFDRGDAADYTDYPVHDGLGRT